MIVCKLKVPLQHFTTALQKSLMITSDRCRRLYSASAVGCSAIHSFTTVAATCRHSKIVMSLLLWQHHRHVFATHTHTRLTAFFPGLPGWAGTRKVKPIWISLKQEIVSGSGISWAICKSTPRSRQITMPAPHHSVFYRPDALPATQPTVSKHWRHW